MRTKKNLLRIGAVIIFACVLFFSSVFLSNQTIESYGKTGVGTERGSQNDTLFYYCYQDTVHLGFSEEKIAVKLYELTPANMEGFMQSQSEIDTTKDPEPVGDGFSIFYVVPGTDIKQLLVDLKTNPYVEMANPVYFIQGYPDYDVIARDQR